MINAYVGFRAIFGNSLTTSLDFLKVQFLKVELGFFSCMPITTAPGLFVHHTKAKTDAQT